MTETCTRTITSMQHITTELRWVEKEDDCSVIITNGIHCIGIRN